MSKTIPPLFLELPPQQPLPYGLYSVAAVYDVPAVRGGVALEPSPVDKAAVGNLTLECGEDTEITTIHAPEPYVRVPFNVYAALACKSVGVTEQSMLEQARAALTPLEPLQVEKKVAGYFEQADTVAGGDAMGQITAAEKHLAGLNVPGVVHAPRWRLPEFEKAGGVVRQGQQLFTPGGHRWVFGSGYEALGGNIAVTGRVVVYRDAVAVNTAFDHSHNDRLVVASRNVGVAIEHTPTAITGAQEG